MNVRIIKDKKHRAIDCEQDGKGCIHNFTEGTQTNQICSDRHNLVVSNES